jgi:hypothetical protein
VLHVLPISASYSKTCLVFFSILSRIGTIYPRKLTLTSPTSGARSVGIICSRTQATEFSF